MVCQAWAVQGYGSPPGVYIVYALKVALYIYGWIFFCSFSPELGGMAGIAEWWLHPVAFQKAILWSMLFEVLGLGCGSGPLTGRYFPPVGGFLYWLRPGTTKLTLLRGVPLLGGNRRNLLDVAAYAGLLILLSLSLIHARPGFQEFVPIIALLALIGLMDKTIFLAARAEHYWVTLIVFAFAPNWIAGAMAVQLALWFFAGFSKLNHHFPTVVCVMASNGPFTPWGWFRKAMYKNYPDDLNPSAAAILKARMGVGLELSVPVVFFAGVMSGSWTVLMAGIVLMLMLHVYITSNVPMGVPIEWNFMVVYGGFFFFLAHGHITPFDIGSVAVGLFILLVSFGLPLLGNLQPDLVSFLVAMRYYAGNWPTSVWLFRGDSYRKLDRLTKSAPWIYDQLLRFYDEKTAVGLVGKVIAFRLMHLHGRVFSKLLPEVIDMRDFNEYTWLDGELVAGMALGWNFGDGHLHHEGLMRNLQEQCGFEPGEVRCIFLEGQPLGRSTIAYRMHDAAEGWLASGQMDVNQLRGEQPWPAGA